MGIKDSSLWAREILSFLETAKNGSINGTAFLLSVFLNADKDSAVIV